MEYKRLSCRLSRITPGAMVALLMALTLLLRLWALHRLPPWLWYDEAGSGLDARELLEGQFQVFFPRSLGKEPLYIYLTAPFVAVLDGEPLAARLAAVLMGVLMVPALYAAGRALWRGNRSAGIWAGTTAAGLWAVNYWPQAINRIGFRANTLPLMLTLAVVAWLTWTQRPSRRCALVFGLLAGLTINTYLAARATLLLWPALFLTLPVQERRATLPTIRWAVLAFALPVAPLVVHFMFYPQDALFRASTATALTAAGSAREATSLLVSSLWQVLGGFLGWAGDPLARHNLPGRPPFSVLLAALFALGLVCALVGLIRRERKAWSLLLWWGVMLLPAILAAEGNPHFLRLFGALPAALLIAAWPVGWAAGRMAPSGRVAHRRWVLVGLLTLLVAGEGLRTAQAYFVTWAQGYDLYPWFMGDIWTYGDQVQARPGAMGLVSRSPYFYVLDYAFQRTSFLQVSLDEVEVEAELDSHVGDLGGATVGIPVWREGLLVDADPKDVLPFYLEREGLVLEREVYRGFDLLTFRVGENPRFSAPGRSIVLNQPFINGPTLLEARWGVGYPNPDRGGGEAAAGTAFWAVLTWQLAQPVPDLKVTLDLLDEQGHRLAGDERLLLNAQHLPTSRWPAGDMARTYHLVAVPPTQPPGMVRLASRVYDAQTLTPLRLETGDEPFTLTVTAARVKPHLNRVRADALSLAHPVQLSVAPGLTLLGADGWPDVVAPGQTLLLRLYWQMDAGWSPERVVDLTLEVGDGGPRSALRLPEDLSPGSVIHTYTDLRLPPDMPEGIHTLRLMAQRTKPVLLGEVTVRGRARRFEPPALQYSLQVTFGDVVALVGADGPALQRVRPGQTVTLTLVWRVLSVPAQDLKRFVHLLGPDQRPLAQEDVWPCQGMCGTSSWLPGEILIEEVRLEIPSGLPAGRYPLGAGWYDAQSLVRLAAQDGSGYSLPNDLAILPLAVEVLP